MKESMKAFLIPVLIAFVSCFPLILHGYPQGHDWIFELVRIVEYHEALSTDKGIPIWGGDLYGGFGSPIFLFYAPLYIASSALLMMAGLPLTIAAITVLVFFSILAAIGMAGLTREILGKDKAGAASAARIASIVFILMPYFFTDMLVRNASAEFVALCLSPLPFWGLALIYRGKLSGMPLLAISFALVIMAHNLTGLTIAAFLMATTICIFLHQRKIRILLCAVTSIILSLGLSCWFWLPALGLKKYVRIDEMLQGKFDFHNNFSPFNEMFHYGGLFAVIIIIASISIINGNRNPLLIGLLSTGIFLVFLQTAPSTLIWETVPFLPLFQFPWRMMGPLALVIALMMGLLFYTHLPQKKFTEAIVICFIVISAVPIWKHYEPMSVKNNEIISNLLTPIGIRLQTLKATVLDEYLPRSANKETSVQGTVDTVIMNSSNELLQINSENTNHTDIQLELETSKSTELHLARWYFPGWKATLNGKEHPVTASSNGTLKIDIPAGRHQLHLWLGQPALRQWGEAVSSVSFIILISLIIARRKKARNTTL